MGVVDFEKAKETRSREILQEIHETLKEKTPMSDTDEWTKSQLQYSHDTFWDFIQCHDLYDQFHTFVMNDCSESFSNGEYQFLINNINLEYKIRELI